MELFIKLLEGILEKIEESGQDENVGIFLAQLIGSLRVTVRNEMEFGCES